MKPLVVIKFNAEIQLLAVRLSIAQKMDRIQEAFQEKLSEYYVLALPDSQEKVPFFDVQVYNADHVKEVDFEQFKAEIKDQLMKQFNPL